MRVINVLVRKSELIPKKIEKVLNNISKSSKKTHVNQGGNRE